MTRNASQLFLTTLLIFFFPMKKIAALFLVLAFLFGSTGISAVQAAGLATLSLSPASASVKTGETVSLSVLMNPNGTMIDTSRVNLNWDASKLEALSFTLGTLFTDLSPSNSISSGSLSYGAFKFGTPVSTSGTLATVKFRALSAGSATVSVGSDSKLISDGTENLNTGALGSSVITITGSKVTPATPAVPATPTVAPATPAVPASAANTEKMALKYFGALAGHLPKTSEEWLALKCMVSDACKVTPANTEKEKKAIAFYLKKYKHLPKTSMEWNTIHAIAYTNAFIKWPAPPAPKVDTPKPVVKPEVKKNEDVNKQAEGLFAKLAKHAAKTVEEKAALKCIAEDGCKTTPRNTDHEKQALALFVKTFKKLPKTNMDWNVVDAIAYTNVFIKWSVVKPVVTPTPAPAAKAPVVKVTTKDQAIGWFGKIYGHLPKSTADWKAVDYMVSGYKPTKQNVDAESKAVSRFAKTFGHLPSSDQDWNIVAAIAYSGAL